MCVGGWGTKSTKLDIVQSPVSLNTTASNAQFSITNQKNYCKMILMTNGSSEGLIFSHCLTFT